MSAPHQRYQFPGGFTSLSDFIMARVADLPLPRPLTDYQEVAQRMLADPSYRPPQWFWYDGMSAAQTPVPPVSDYGIQWAPFREMSSSVLGEGVDWEATSFRVGRVSADQAPWVSRVVDPDTGKSAVDRLYGYFSGLSAGRSHTRPVRLVPFYRPRDKFTVSERVDRDVRNLIERITNPLVAGFERHKWETKVGPQGCIPPLDSKEAMESTLRYGRPRHPMGIPYPVAALLKSLLPGSIGLWSDEQLTTYAREHGKGSSSSGFPLNKKRKLCEAETIADSHTGACNAYPNKRGGRGQRQGQYKSMNSGSVKGVRTVYSTPASKNWRDARFLSPVEAFLKSSPVFRQWVAADAGPNKLDCYLVSALSDATYAWVLSRDYSKMDTTIGYQLRLWAAKLLSYAYQPQLRDEFVANVMSSWDTPLVVGMTKRSKLSCAELFRPIRASGTGEVLFQAPPLDPELLQDECDFLLIQARDQGLTSGERVTHTIEDEISIIVDLIEIILFKVKMLASFVDGDDGLSYGLDASQMKDVARIFETSCAMLGLIGNADKQDITPGTGFYLQCAITEDTGYLPSYSLSMCVNSLLFPERQPTVHAPLGNNDPFWSDKVYALRSLMILENCEFNPLFEELCTTVMEWFPHRCGCAIPGFYDATPDSECSTALDFIWNSLLDDGDVPQSARRKKSLRDFRAYKFFKAKSVTEQEVAIRGARMQAYSETDSSEGSR